DIREPHRGLALGGVLARWRRIGRQATAQNRRGMVQACAELVQGHFTSGVPLLCRKAARFVIKVMSQDLPHPSQEFALVSTRKLSEVTVYLHEGLLHDVARIAFSAQMPAQLRPREQPKVMAIALEEQFARGRLPFPATCDQLG